MYFFYFNKKSLLCNYCFLYFYDWIFTFTLVFSDAYVIKCKKQIRDRWSFLSLVCFSQNKVWGITNIKYRGLHYEMIGAEFFPDI